MRGIHIILSEVKFSEVTFVAISLKCIASQECKPLRSRILWEWQVVSLSKPYWLVLIIYLNIRNVLTLRPTDSNMHPHVIYNIRHLSCWDLHLRLLLLIRIIITASIKFWTDYGIIVLIFTTHWSVNLQKDFWGLGGIQIELIIWSQPHSYEIINVIALILRC